MLNLIINKLNFIIKLALNFFYFIVVEFKKLIFICITCSKRFCCEFVEIVELLLDIVD